MATAAAGTSARRTTSRLNLLVERCDAAPAAVAAMDAYATNGDLSIPLVTLHATADEIAPFAHELLSCPRWTAPCGLFVPIPIARYGHCNSSATEVGLSLLFAVNLPWADARTAADGWRLSAGSARRWRGP